MSRGLISLSDQNFGFAGGRGDSKPPRGDVPSYAKPVVVRKLDENSSAISVDTDTAETTIATLTLPPLILQSTGAARLSAVGTLDKNTAGTYTIRVKAADQTSTATVLATSAFTVASDANEHAWTLEAWFLGKQPNVNRTWGVFDASVAGTRGTLSPSTFSSLGWSTSSLDETEEWTITITAEMSVSSASLGVSRQVAILEGIN